MRKLETVILTCQSFEFQLSSEGAAAGQRGPAIIWLTVQRIMQTICHATQLEIQNAISG